MTPAPNPFLTILLAPLLPEFAVCGVIVISSIALVLGPTSRGLMKAEVARYAAYYRVPAPLLRQTVVLLARARSIPPALAPLVPLAHPIALQTLATETRSYARVRRAAWVALPFAGALLLLSIVCCVLGNGLLVVQFAMVGLDVVLIAGLEAVYLLYLPRHSDRRLAALQGA